MENIINTLVTIEHRAQKLTQEAREVRQNLSHQIDEQKKVIEENIFGDIKKQIAHYQTQKDMDTGQVLTSLEAKIEQTISALNNQFEASKNELKQQLLHAIIGR